MLHILINIFWLIKIKTKRFGISYHNHIFFPYHNDLINLLKATANLSCHIFDIQSYCTIFNFSGYWRMLGFWLLLLVFHDLFHIFGVLQIFIDCCLWCHISENVFFRMLLMFAPLSAPACYFKWHKSNF